MPGTRRPGSAVEVDRRLREQRARLGAEVHGLRERRGWTRIELGRRAGLGRMVIGRLERGVGAVDLDGLIRISVACDQPLTVSFGRDRLEAPADAGHLAIQELVLRLGRAGAFQASFELPTKPAEPWRSADVVLTDDAAHRLVVAECWNTIGDVGAAARSSERKRAEAEQLAHGRWGPEVEVGLVWIVRATARNRMLLARYPEVFARRFPGSSRGWVMTLTSGDQPPTNPGLVWCDVAATRFFAWRRPPL